MGYRLFNDERRVLICSRTLKFHIRSSRNLGTKLQEHRNCDFRGDSDLVHGGARNGSQRPARGGEPGASRQRTGRGEAPCRWRRGEACRYVRISGLLLWAGSGAGAF